jgi:serine/threonine-protein kinase RsbW
MRFSLPSCKDQLGPLRDRLRQLLADAGVSGTAAHDIVLSVHEAVVNGMVHGNRLDPRRTVSVEIQFGPRGVEIEVADEGPGFDWRGRLGRVEREGVPPDAPEGRGMLVMVRTMDHVAYSEPGNRVRLVRLCSR